MVGPEPVADDGPMTFLLMLGALGILAVSGAVTAVRTATSPEVDTGRRVVLWIVAGLLGLLTLFLALVGYLVWDFVHNFSF